MHIPDGYLGPATCGVFYAAMIPIWAVASKMVRKTLKAAHVPFLAIGAAFTFVIMMFVAILLGPWAACIAITVSLVIQALLFGDGGITAIGANCFNMAFVLPFVGYYIYKAISYNAPADSNRKVLAAGVAGYIGINVAALLAGVEFGAQPLLHHTASGQALYCPYGLNVAVPAMAGEHLLIFGWIEAIVTALVVKYLHKQSPELIEEREAA